MGLQSARTPESTRLRLVSRGSAGGDQPRVVIVGAGFGGLTAAKRLVKAAVEVTLIDRENHHLFQPLLYQVVTVGLSPAEIAWPIRGLLRRQRNTRVLLGEVTGGLKWTDTREIAIELSEKFPVINPITVRFTDQHKWVMGLPDFDDKPEALRRKNP